ncbi:MAG: DUF5715 family protein [Blastocatellia bacterium]|nr:DUF5715 family protein [Blastocatellia bacterium]
MMRAKSFTRHGLTAINLTAIIFLAALLLAGCKRGPGETIAPPSAEARTSPLEEALHKVEENRGEPAGRKAEVEVPGELKHYSDRRRFLAVQVAEWRKHRYNIPHDYVELIGMIRSEELVEMEPLGEHYVLYGVGESANDGRFTHFDRATSEEITLFASHEDFEIEYGRLTETITELQSKIADLSKELKKTSRHDRNGRRALQEQITQARKNSIEISKTQKSLAHFYNDPERRKMLLSEHEAIASLAADFKGESYNLNAPPDRKRLKARLLSFIRPEARDLIMEISRTYREKSGRPLPVTSLVRTEEYQRHLGATNKNATQIAVPPHTTGLAFDIYDGYMTAAEQSDLMAVIAGLEATGRVEALRESRNHIHVFAFADGRPPDERSIAKALNEIGNRRYKR